MKRCCGCRMTLMIIWIERCRYSLHDGTTYALLWNICHHVRSLEVPRNTSDPTNTQVRQLLESSDGEVQTAIGAGFAIAHHRGVDGFALV